MIEREIFDKDDLRHVYWQLQVRFSSCFNFHRGDIVFLKSNPEVPLRVEMLLATSNEVMIKVIGTKNHFVTKPECLLHYQYHCLLISFDGRFRICLN